MKVTRKWKEKRKRKGIRLYVAVCMPVVLAAPFLAVGCSATSARVEISLKDKMEKFLSAGAFFGEEGAQEKKIDTYWQLLKKGEVLKSYLKGLSLTEDGTWAGNDDFIEKVVGYVFPENIVQLKMEEKMALSKGVKNYLVLPLSNLAKSFIEQVGGGFSIASELIQKSLSGNNYAALKLSLQMNNTVSGEKQKSKEEIIKSLNESIQRETKSEGEVNAFVVRRFGLFTEKQGSLSIMSKSEEDAAEKINNIFKNIINAPLTEYQLLAEPSGTLKGAVQKEEKAQNTSGKYYVIWKKGRGFATQAFEDYFDENRTQGSDEITIKCVLTVADERQT